MKIELAYGKSVLNVDLPENAEATIIRKPGLSVTAFA